MTMRLSQLISNLSFAADYEIKRLMLDSRKIEPGDAFIALAGTKSDGRQFAAEAVARGAVVVLIETDQEAFPVTYLNETPIIPIRHLRDKLSSIAARFYHYPAKQIRMFGVTGTNGKTSCTFFIAQLLKALNIPCGIIGTLGCGFYGDLTETGLTTPDAITLQELLRHFADDKATCVAMEVSSHSIVQKRANALEFEVGIFTNLTQDHLDYHGDMQTYAEVKRSFLASAQTKQLVINADDAYGHRWIKELSQEKPVYAYSQKAVDLSNIPCVYAEAPVFTTVGTHFILNSPWGKDELFLPLVGEFNLSNALAIITTLLLYGIPFKELKNPLAALKPVPGRMQSFGGQHKALVIVDYAHTPDALEKVLKTLRQQAKGKLICVFGCGGDRDQGKRPLMAEVVEQYADIAIVTNDNPRHEKPEVIAKQILAGFKEPKKVLVELDRSKAIKNSIQLAEANDCVLIAGKGAERYQQIGDEKQPFDDTAIVGQYLTDR